MSIFFLALLPCLYSPVFTPLSLLPSLRLLDFIPASLPLDICSYSGSECESLFESSCHSFLWFVVSLKCFFSAGGKKVIPKMEDIEIRTFLGTLLSLLLSFDVLIDEVDTLLPFVLQVVSCPGVTDGQSLVLLLVYTVRLCSYFLCFPSMTSWFCFIIVSFLHTFSIWHMCHSSFCERYSVFSWLLISISWFLVSN